MKKSDQINEISKALAAAQREMKAALKDSTNPFYNSRYSDIATIWDIIREPLMSREIAIVQDAVNGERGVEVTTILLHSTGQWIEFGPLCIPLTKKDAHGIGSAITYAKRYALCAAVGIVSSDDDDDGNAAKEAYHAKEKPNTPFEKISKQEIDQLNYLLKKLPAVIQEKFWDYLKALKCNDWSDITIGQFPMIIKNLNSRIKQIEEQNNAT